MARLTSFSKFLIALFIVGGIFLTYRYCASQKNANPDSTTAEATSASPDATGDLHKPNQATSPNTPQSANSSQIAQPNSRAVASPTGESQAQAVPQTTGEAATDAASEGKAAPPEAKPAKPVRNFAYTPTKPVNGKLKGVVELGASGFNSFIIDVDRKKNWELKKAEWGSSMVYDGLASGQDITQGLKKYILNILDFGVSGRDVHFVVSSGALKTKEVQPIIKGLKKIGYFVNEVTPAEEGTNALKSVLPKAFEDKAFVVDIGSGNTKISWLENGRIKAKETYGAKYYKDKIQDNKAYADAKKISEQIPKGKELAFIIGGVPFQLAKQGRKNKERYTVLQSPNNYEADGAKLKSGLNIYKAIQDGSGCDYYVFDWEANFTIGFLLGLSY